MDSKALRNSLITSFKDVRALSLKICEPLETEDYLLQSMPEASPAKWHLGHTTWFFETFLLARFKKSYKPFHQNFRYIFNSYYETVGRYPDRAQRGQISRPSINVIGTYRSTIDDEVAMLITTCRDEILGEIKETLTLGLNHEQQHQELLITDIKHAFYQNPTHPVFIEKNTLNAIHGATTCSPLEWLPFSGGIHSIGAQGAGFAFDNEKPQHQILANDFLLSSRLVTNGEFIEFIESNGYDNSTFWLQLGFDEIKKHNQREPLYWQKQDGAWWVFTLNGLEPVDKEEPVSHVSFYEADAYARFCNARLPTEAEWEIAAATLPKNALLQHNNLSTFALRPLKTCGVGLQQIYGDTWEWTNSAYLPYPGFKPLIGTEGEYNAKFMSNQMVLKGGSCATPKGHIRASYRNFFPPHAKWQFSGIRLAKDVSKNQKIRP